jgi:hypothetical protein
MFEAINVLLKRNNELRFVQPLDVDHLINEAVRLFQQQSQSADSLNDFYDLPMKLVGGSTGYMIRAIIHYLFNSNVPKDGGQELTNDACQIS